MPLTFIMGGFAEIGDPPGFDFALVRYEVDLPEPDPVILLEELIDCLLAIVEANSGTPLADKLEDAIGYLLDALVKLETPPDNQAAVGDIEGAVGDLDDAVDLFGLDPGLCGLRFR